MQTRYLIAVFNNVECQNEEVTLRLGVLFSSVQFYLISVWSKYKIQRLTVCMRWDFETYQL